MVSQLRGHHVLPPQDVRQTLLPPNRREPMGGWTTQTTRHRHARATRPLQQTRDNSTLCWSRALAGSVRLAALGSRQRATPHHHHTTHRTGPHLRAALAPDRCRHVVEQLLKGRRFEFDVERAIFLTVLHRLFASTVTAPPTSGGPTTRSRVATTSNSTTSTGPWPGSARNCPRISRRTRRHSHPVASRIGSRKTCGHRRDLFSGLQLVFFDTTSIDFEGEGGQDIGQRGFSKDHRPRPLPDGRRSGARRPGAPICRELWAGATPPM